MKKKKSKKAKDKNLPRHVLTHVSSEEGKTWFDAVVEPKCEGNALVLIHGIGEQKYGQTVVGFCKSLFRYYFSDIKTRRFRKYFKDMKSDYSLQFSFSNPDVKEEFDKWLEGKGVLGWFINEIRRYSKIYKHLSDRATKQIKKKKNDKRSKPEKEKEHPYVDIKITHKENKGKARSATFRIYEVYWADRFKAQHWGHVWQMFGSVVFRLIRDLDIRRPFHFFFRFLINLYWILFLLVFSLILVLLMTFYLRSSRFQKGLIGWIKVKFENYIGDLSMYIENQEDAKNVRSTFQTFLAEFFGYRWNPSMRSSKKQKISDHYKYEVSRKNRGNGNKKVFNKISVISHSLGSLIAYEVLSKIDFDGTDSLLDGKFRTFITTGSPLEHIFQFWGNRKSRFGYKLNGALKNHWHNYWDFADPVSSRISNYDPYPTNHIVSASFIRRICPFTHNNYKDNIPFFNELLERSLSNKYRPWLRNDLKYKKKKIKSWKLTKNLIKLIWTVLLYSIFLAFIGICGYHIAIQLGIWFYQISKGLVIGIESGLAQIF